MTKNKAFATTLGILAATFRQELDPPAIAGYELALDDLTENEFRMVCRRALRECKFMPTPAELLAFAGKGGPLAIAAEIAEAWTAARWARRVHSYTTGVDFGPLVNAVIRSMGGWLVFCGHNDDALEAFERKKFEIAYAAFRERRGRGLGAMGEPLRGEFAGVELVEVGGRRPQARLRVARDPDAEDLIRTLADAKAAR